MQFKSSIYAILGSIALLKNAIALPLPVAFDDARDINASNPSNRLPYSAQGNSNTQYHTRPPSYSSTQDFGRPLNDWIPLTPYSPPHVDLPPLAHLNSGSSNLAYGSQSTPSQYNTNRNDQENYEIGFRAGYTLCYSPAYIKGANDAKERRTKTIPPFTPPYEENVPPEQQVGFERGCYVGNSQGYLDGYANKRDPKDSEYADANLETLPGAVLDNMVSYSMDYENKLRITLATAFFSGPSAGLAPISHARDDDSEDGCGSCPNECCIM